MPSWLETAEKLNEYTIPVAASHPGGHVFIKHPDETHEGIWTICDPFMLEAFHQTLLGITNKVEPNLKMMLGWQYESPVVCVDLDVKNDSDVFSKAKALGVSREGTWMEYTPTKGLHVFYRNPHDRELSTAQHDEEQPGIDLLATYVTIAPSTRQEGGYVWLKGHSPWDVLMHELPFPSKGILDLWAKRSESHGDERNVGRVSVDTTNPLKTHVTLPGATRFDIRVLTSALGCGRQGCACKGGKVTHCPAHTDQKPSFSVKEHQGKVLVHCFAGCGQDEVIVALKQRGLWPKGRGEVSIEGRGDGLRLFLE